MGSVRNPVAGAWVPQWGFIQGKSGPLLIAAGASVCTQASYLTSGTSLGVIVQDLLYVGLTIVVFAVLTLILKGIERFER
jgi:hypothetical protein